MRGAAILPVILLALMLAACGIKGQPRTPSGHPLPVPAPQKPQASLPTG